MTIDFCNTSRQHLICEPYTDCFCATLQEASHQAVPADSTAAIAGTHPEYRSSSARDAGTRRECAQRGEGQPVHGTGRANAPQLAHGVRLDGSGGGTPVPDHCED